MFTGLSPTRGATMSHSESIRWSLSHIQSEIRTIAFVNQWRSIEHIISGYTPLSLHFAVVIIELDDFRQ